MSDLSEAVQQMESAAVALQPYIQHICSYSTSIGASSPDSDYCTCGMGRAIMAANKALSRLRFLASRVPVDQTPLCDVTIAGMTIPEIVAMRAELDALRPRAVRVPKE